MECEIKSVVAIIENGCPCLSFEQTITHCRVKIAAMVSVPFVTLA